VPATSANIGPGFDVLGLGLSLYLTLDVHLVPQESKERPTLSYSGQGEKEAPLDPYKNLITRVALYVLRCHGQQLFPSRLSIHVHNDIPFGRGLGSSGAAVIAGVLLANALGEFNLSTNRMLDFALMVERHPDNVTAALVGGFAGSYLRDLSPEEASAAQVPLAEVLPEYPPDAGEDWGRNPPLPPTGISHFIKFDWAKEIKAVAVIPEFEVSTAKARGALQAEYKLKDCVCPAPLLFCPFVRH
jgi:homoserine kinase